VSAELIALASGHVLAAYFSDGEHTELRVDEYAPEKREWTARARIPRSALGEERPTDWLSIDDLVEIEDGVMLFVGSCRAKSAVGGLSPPQSGDWSLIASENVPCSGHRNSFAYRREDPVPYPTTERWKEVAREGAPSPRANCVCRWTGAEVFLWGGRAQGGEALTDAHAYDPEADRWRELPALPAVLED